MVERYAKKQGDGSMLREKTISLILLNALILTGLILPIAPPERTATTMPIQIKEWVQDEWKRAGVDLEQKKGDFWNFQGLMVDERGKLKRAPAWSDAVTIPLTKIQNVFYDRVTGSDPRVVFLGLYGTYDLYSAYATPKDSWSVSSRSSLQTSVTPYSFGLFARGALWTGTHLYQCWEHQILYDTDYSSTLATLHSNADTGRSAQVLTAYGDYVFAAFDNGEIVRLDSTGAAMAAFYTPVDTQRIEYLIPFKQQLIAGIRDQNGSFYIAKFQPHHATGSIEIIGQLERVAGEDHYGLLMVPHDGDIYLSYGQRANPDNTQSVTIYRFDGSSLERITDLTLDSYTSTAGLVSWNGELIFWAMYQNGSTAPTLKILVGENSFADFTPLAITPAAGTLTTLDAAGEYLLATVDGSAYHSDNGLADGHVETSRLDMGYPGRPKRLARLTVLLDGAAADFDVTVKYRIDDAASWTTAASAQDGSKRVSVDFGVSGVEFYTLQIRVELDDNTGGDEDIRIQVISATYSIGE